MKFLIQRAQPATIAADVLLVGVYENTLQTGANSLFASADAVRMVAHANADRFTGKVGQVSSQFSSTGRVVLFGLGDRNSLSGEQLRDALEAGFKEAKRLKVSNIVVSEIEYPQSGVDRTQFGRLVGEVAGLVDYTMLNYKTEKGGHKPESRFAQVVVASVDGDDAVLKAALAEGRTIAQSVNTARDLVVTPPDIMNPTQLAAEAKKIADASAGRIVCVLHTGDDLKKLNANGLLAVAQGSAQEPVLIELTYYPADADPNVTLALVGKSVTFDSGGYDMKPADGMRWMKSDMAGGAATLAAINAIAALRIPVRVKVLMAATDNMVNEKAYRPSEVLHMMSGLTVEVDNTDAEGRLTLADAIEYAKLNGATHIVDVATLTGAVRVALGTLGAGGFSNDDALFALVDTASKRSGELIHRFPLWAGYAKANESKIADLKNSGGAAFGAGHITAAWFLRKFAGDTPWVHLDIAGVGFKDEEGTGWGVRTLVELARVFAEQPRQS
ncbi:MAG: leucyl aminopeptidase family protein [Candidatus Obscuribacterales bacterium]|nr:leucyl aminopeptidase family protein [Candidatus Obscuribacterales bacterium]